MNGASTPAGASRCATDQQVVPEAAEQAHRAHQHDDGRIALRRPEERHRDGDHGPRPPGWNRSWWSRCCRCARECASRSSRSHSRSRPIDREQRRRMDAAGARPRDQQDAAEADDDRGPAPPADPFAEHRAAERRDDERRAEDDRDRLVELQIAQREEVERGGDEQQRRAAELQPRPRGAHHLRAPDRIEHGQREHERRHVARPHHLHGVHVAVEEFRGRVVAGEQQHRAAHQRDAGQPVALRLLGRTQYVARPPEMSNTAPVVKELSAEAHQAASAAISSTLTKRARGIFESM